MPTLTHFLCFRWERVLCASVSWAALKEPFWVAPDPHSHLCPPALGPKPASWEVPWQDQLEPREQRKPRPGLFHLLCPLPQSPLPCSCLEPCGSPLAGSPQRARTVPSSTDPHWRCVHQLSPHYAWSPLTLLWPHTGQGPGTQSSECWVQ